MHGEMKHHRHVTLQLLWDDRRSTLITSQIPVDQWHAYLGDRTVADAILDRLVHNSYRIVLKGESMRRHKTAAGKPAVTSKSKNI
jgi:DNA replication protein DnaC